ncbi:hypothetical protein KAFR_0C00620 [Kazachstania africana CBS 2517]|uniref:Very long-chain fatty acid transport protein n=1 Tax=Kazachstania africana (strain ATCC 22294 / BCRC 22015 / CBS 2517 / CECT 1963 / NBRC 1671 / NRRL Y-8276) TaxID=1071382 RepID=H2ARQ7_KAZAF|nr:hypothetical protein KAFR_0C00620 [Kazachstania africana CBS 2517]CCF57057.1 hypothetical protein KAFR_0C00620 [Kazachstania africana CBS 2517]
MKSILSILGFIITRVLLLLFRILRIILFPITKLISWSCGDFFHRLNEKHRISEDLYIIPYFFEAIFSYIWALNRHRFQNWYLFENEVLKNGSNLAIRYVRPIPGSKDNFNLESYTYQEFYDIVLRLSYILYNTYDVNPNDHIAIHCTNKPMFMFIWFALWNIGAIPAFLNYNTKGKPLVHSLEISNIKQVFIDLESSQPVKDTEVEINQTLPDIKLNFFEEQELMNMLLDTESPQFLQTTEERSPADLTDFQPSMLIYTSGTTGLPKSAIMSWRKSSIGCQLFGHVTHMNDKSNVFTAMPLFHSTAALLGACAIISKGGCISIANKFSARNFWKQASLTEATHVEYVGEVCRYLLHSPISEYDSTHNVKVAYGNGLRPDIWQQFRKRFNIEVIGEFYAATEAPFATTTYQRGDFGVGACRSYGTIINWFLALQQTLVKVNPEDDTLIYRNTKGFCEEPAVGEPGELLMRIFFPKKPETSFQGYLGNEKETKSKVIRNVFRKEDAWYRCGDLLKSDEFGQWYFLDRTGDTFRWKSENVSTTEVEDQVISTNESEIMQVSVVGLKLPKYEGRCGYAIIRLKDESMGASEKINLLNNTLIELHKVLPKYALPIFVRFVDEIKMTDNHKVLKKLYRTQKLPAGEDGKDDIYWLRDYKEYRKLTGEDWKGIQEGTYKL